MEVESSANDMRLIALEGAEFGSLVARRGNQRKVAGQTEPTSNETVRNTCSHTHPHIDLMMTWMTMEGSEGSEGT